MSSTQSVTLERLRPLTDAPISASDNVGDTHERDLQWI
jgi:hypothetical protein